MTQKLHHPNFQIHHYCSYFSNPPKTPSKQIDTSSSSIDYIPKSPTSSTSPSPNGYLNPSTSPPPRVSLPPPTQDNASIDITLTLSPNTPLDVGAETLEEEMLMGSSNHLVEGAGAIGALSDDLARNLGNGSSSGGHECVWLLMMSEGDGELVLCIWREFMGRDLFENGMNLDKFREFQMFSSIPG
ncbi:hypothetical protein Tco_0103912 [Tanacetum coccineum]